MEDHPYLTSNGTVLSGTLDERDRKKSENPGKIAVEAGLLSKGQLKSIA